MTIKVGLTGGIGAGKSTIAKALEKLGFGVYISDNEASRLIVENSTIISELKALCGDDIYLPNGKLNKEKMTSLIFNDVNIRKSVNSIVHPIVIQDFEERCKQSANAIEFFESAIIFDSNLTPHFDCTIYIYTPLAIRLARVCKRDSTTIEKALERILCQMKDEDAIKIADYTINSGSGILMMPQIERILESIKSKAWQNTQNG